MDIIALGLDQVAASRFSRPTAKTVSVEKHVEPTAPFANSAPAAEGEEVAAPPKENLRTSDWTFAAGMKLNVSDPTSQIPLIDQNFPVIDDKHFVWDTWALRDIRGRTIEYKGWKVVMSLVSDRGEGGDNIYDQWHNRNNFSYIAFYYSRSGDTLDWKFGGKVITEGANKRDWQWSGSAMMRDGTDNTVDLFFTSVNGTPNESVVAHVEGKIYADENGVTFAGFDKVEDLFQADGVHYSSVGQNPYRDFRDPHVFINPEDGECYVLFEGDMPGMRGALTITEGEIGTLPPGYTMPAGGVFAAGCIGMGKCLSNWRQGDFSKWSLYDPLISALPVTGQTERPHVVFKDGLTYVFTICHHAFFAPGLTGADGVYGFVSHDGIFGKFEPLNGSGLVLANPTSAPFQTYSHFVDPQGYVIAFIDTLPALGSTDPENPAQYRIGGTQAPTLKLNLKGNSTFIEGVYDYGQIFAEYEWSKSTAADVFPEGVAKPVPQGIVAE